VVEWFADLPEPIRNAATAALIFNAAGGPTSKILENVTTGITNTISGFSGWTGTFEGATSSTDDFKAAVGLATESIGRSARRGLRGALDGVMGIFGGPWGIAIMGATALITMWAEENREAKERADELTATLDEQTGAFTQASEELVQAQIVDKIQETADSLTPFGDYMEAAEVTVADMTAAIIDQGDAHDYLLDKLTESAMGAEGIDDEESARRMAKNNEIWEYVEEQIEAQRLEQEAIEAVAEAEKERYLAMDEGERSYQRYTESMGEAVDETLNMNDRVRALKEALDELNGVTKTQEERDRELAGTQRDLNEWFEDNGEEIAGMDEALIDMSTGMPGHTELGDQLAGMLERMGDAAHEDALAIRDRADAEGWSTEKTQEAITEAYEPYIETLQSLQEQGYLTQEEVDALTDSIIGVPEITSILITAGDSIGQTESEVINLVSEIEAIPEGEAYITDKDSIEHLLDDLEDMEYEVEHLDDGEVKITPIGIPEAVDAINDNLIDRDWSTTVTVRTVLTGKTPEQRVQEAREGGPGWGIVAPRYYGGIDVKGMAAGGLTGASVMDIAQMVSPGDIRFAGDRSDVDEAWIPLDGSPRSVAILEEAIARMPGYEPEGMAAGGITGTLVPPQVEDVDAPDTTALQEVWAETMAYLEESTRGTFETIQADTSASQDATTEATTANMTLMRDITSTLLAMMVAETQSGMAGMYEQTSQHTAGMRDVTNQNLTAMDADTLRLTTGMRETTASQMGQMDVDTYNRMTSMRETVGARFEGMNLVATSQADQLRYGVSQHFFDMHDYATGQVQGLRSDSDTEFTSMRDHGVDAAGELRAGVVDEMSRARSPFTGHVNDLVQVMRDFSDAMNDAYGDMGVDVGKPSRLSAATGAILPGYNPGVDNHTFTSPTGGILELSGGEGVSRPEVVQAMGAGTFNALNAAARSGGVRGVQQALTSLIPRQAFSDGGIIDDFTGEAKAIGTEYKGLLPDNWLKPAGKSIIDTVVDGMNDMLASLFTGAGWVRPTTGRVTSDYGPRWGTHHAGMDIADGEGTPVVAPTAMRILETGANIGPGRTGQGILGELMGGMYSYFGHNPVGGIRVRPGDLVAPGQRIGAQGSTGNVTGAHLHWEVHQGSPWNDINPHPFWDAAGPGSGAVTMPGGGNDHWTGIITQALRLVGLPTTPPYVQGWLRQGQTESGLNPRAVQRVHDINSIMGNHARGIVQVIPPTFAAYSLPGMKDIFNPLHNFAAGMNYAKNRYGVTGMLSAIGQGRGYKHGTDHALPGWAWVGETGPELVRFRGGEQVMSNTDSRAAVAGGLHVTNEAADRIGKAIARNLPPNAVVNINHPTTRDTDELARAAINELDTQMTWLSLTP
jgi:SLT domain-containing protein